MEHRRFDSFVRAFANGSSRRGMLQGAALASAASLVPTAVRADGGVGPSPATICVCNNDRPSVGVTAAPPFPAAIVPGTCDKYDDAKAIDLKSVGDAVNRPASQSSVIGIVQSESTVDSTLAELLSASYAVIVQASGTDPTLVACGNLGAKASGKALAVGLKEQNGSGYSGVVNIVTTDAGATVDLFVGRGLFQTTSEGTTAAFPVGSMVVAQTDINLRKTPADNGAVVVILGEGSELKVTGDAQGKWLPVDDVASGDSGFVDATYVIPE